MTLRRRRTKGWLLSLLISFLLVELCRGNKCPPPENIMPCRCRGRNDQIQVWCSHSDLERVNGALENLMRLRSMPAIDELIVENNKMPTLPARAFGALQIGRLLLRNNGLESLSRNAFAGLEDSLEEIYIVEEKLTDFPFDAIEKLRNLEAFTIEKSRIRLLPRFSGLNRLKHIRIEGSLISGFPVGAFASMSSIKQIHVVNSGVDRLAEGIFGRLDSLLLANFTGNRIDHIQRRCFSLLPRLEVLSLGGNRLGEAASVGRSMEELVSLKSLDLSNNQFKELPEGSFVNLRSLQLLNLAGNQISRVHTRSFTHLPALRKVDLSQNLLRNFPRMLFDTTPLLEELRMRRNLLGTANEVGQMLTSLKSLRYLDLGENGLTELPTGAVKDHTHLQTLDLSDNRITRIQRHAFQNVPSLQEISLKNNSIKTLDGDAWDIPSLKELDISINNLEELNQMSLKGLTKLARIDLSQNSIKSVPPSVFTNNKEIEFLDLSGNGMTSLNSDSLSGLNKLNKLDLSRNHLESLQPGSFRDLQTLVSLNIANNRINNVPMNLLNELKTLEELNFRSNSLSFIPPGFFQSLKALKDLNLKHNSLAEINARMFSGLDNLEQLRLSTNQINRFDETAFNSLLKLRGIDLSSNRLSKLPSGSFKNLPSLERFEARENRINQVENGVLANSEGLQILDLAHNALTSVPQILMANPLLKVVDLSHNQINNLQPDTFSKLAVLMELYLNDNKFKVIHPGTFQNLSSLTIVDLDGNELEEIPPGAFKNLPRLIYLRMSRNKIRSVGRGGFSNLNSLDGLDLQENELEEISPGGFDKTGALKYLNLSHNNLDQMSRMGLLSLASLEVLDLSYNKISTVDTDPLRHLIWLVELRMNDNGICMIPTGTFDGMSRLKMLVLRNNRLKHLYESVFYKLRNNIAFMDVSGNPLECDCEMTWLRNLMAREELQELTDSVCDGPGDLKGTQVKKARPGRMICSASSTTSRGSYNNKRDEDCPPLAKSKRKPRPASVEPEDRPLFGNNVQDEFYGEPEHNELKNNRRKDEKLIESNDYISGDTPTIYAGSSITSNTKATQQDVKKSSSGSVLSSLFGIPIDFGLNFGISPSFSWSDKGKAKHNGLITSKDGSRASTVQDPLPPSWIERPSKGSINSGNIYEAPEYLPRKPPQPYIPLNPLSLNINDGAQSVLPSGSVVNNKMVTPHENGRKSSGIKFPEGPSSPPRTSWHPNYPNTETGFIPIEPFFHNKNQPKNSSKTLASSTEKYYSTSLPNNFNQIHYDAKQRPLSSSSTTEKGLFGRPTTEDARITSPSGSSSTSDSEEYEEEEPNFTPVQTQTTEKNKNDDISLSDFWGMFSNGKDKKNNTNTRTTGQNHGSQDDDIREGPNKDQESYEDPEEQNNINRPPFNFSAPVDNPMEPDEPEYNIPFGEPSGSGGGLGRGVHVTGRPTITKIIETDLPFNNNNNNHNNNNNNINNYHENSPVPSPNVGNYIQDITEDDAEDEIGGGNKLNKVILAGGEDNPSPSPLVPPVIIGNRDAEPRDWYYTNYHKSSNGNGGGDEILERLLERSRVNQLQDDLVTFNAAHTYLNHSSKYRYFLLSLLYYLVFVN